MESTSSSEVVTDVATQVAAEVDRVAGKLAEVADPRLLLETLFAEASVAFGIYSADGRCVVVNRAFRELFGVDPPPEYNLFHDEVAARLGLGDHVRRSFSGERVHVPAFWYDASELEHVKVAGRRVAIEVTTFPLRGRGGANEHVAICFKDVTAEHALRISEARYRTAFDVAPEAILVTEAFTGRIIEANEVAARLFGYPRAELQALIVGELHAEFQPDGRRSTEAGPAFMLRAMEGERPVFEWMHRDRTGASIACEVRLVELPSEGRRLCRATIIDLTERKRGEAARRRAQELEEAHRRIAAANQLKSEFLANMSHELRTPLNSIIGFAELLYYRQVEPDSAEHAEFLGDILTSGRHLLQLINDVLDLAKVEAGRLEFRPQSVVVDSMVAEVTGVLRTLALQKRIRIEVEHDLALAVVVLDPARFKQVLYNYLSNALKFTPEGGRIIVRTCSEVGDRFRLEVEDSGAGIPADQLDKLFVEFQQLEAGLAAGQGTGLGLALTRRIVEAQGGSVGVRSRLGDGTVFHAVLPFRPTMAP